MTPKERARLRGLANGIDTVLQIGKDGIGENLIHQADITLEARELIKGRVLDGCMGYTPRTAAEALAQATGSEVVQVIGSKFVLYRKKSPDAEKKTAKPRRHGNARDMETRHESRLRQAMPRRASRIPVTAQRASRTSIMTRRENRSRQITPESENRSRRTVPDSGSPSRGITPESGNRSAMPKRESHSAVMESGKRPRREAPDSAKQFRRMAGDRVRPAAQGNRPTAERIENKEADG